MLITPAYGRMGARLVGLLYMSDWQTELDELLARTTAFTSSIKTEAEVPQSQRREAVEHIGFTPLNRWGGSEREEIKKRVAIFTAHQQRLIRDREEYAASQLSRMRRPSSFG